MFLRGFLGGAMEEVNLPLVEETLKEAGRLRKV